MFQALPHPHDNCSRSLGKRSRFGVQWREKEGTYLRQVVLPCWASSLQRTYQAPVLCPCQAASRGGTLTEGWAQVPVACSSLMPPRGHLYQQLPKSTEKRGRVVAPAASSLDGCDAELDQDEIRPRGWELLTGVRRYCAVLIITRSGLTRAFLSS